MTERAARAARRRATWNGDVVQLGQAKPCLYADLRLDERLIAYARLNLRAWLAAGNPPPVPEPRSTWPGEIIDLRRHD